MVFEGLEFGIQTGEIGLVVFVLPVRLLSVLNFVVQTSSSAHQVGKTRHSTASF